MTEIHEQLAAAAREVARLAGGAEAGRLDDPTPCPDYTVRELTAHLLQEIVLHGWDLAAATGQTPQFPDEVAATVLSWLDHGEDTSQEAGWYRSSVPTDSALPLDRAVGRSGRDPAWRPPA